MEAFDMIQRTTLLGLGLVLTSATLLSAQSTKPVYRPVGIEHATVGKLEAFDGNARVIVLAPAPDLREENTPCAGRSRTFSVTPTTHVLGTIDAEGLDALNGLVDGIVLVRYIDAPDRPQAQRIWFIDEPQVREAAGSLVRIDHASRTLVLRNRMGAEETMSLKHDFLVDSDAGVGTLANLRNGQTIDVYYTKQGGENTARLLRIVS
jgi:hypothetical protein